MVEASSQDVDVDQHSHLTTGELSECFIPVLRLGVDSPTGDTAPRELTCQRFRMGNVAGEDNGLSSPGDFHP